MIIIGKKFRVESELCRVPKLFRLPSKLGRIVQDMKLNKTKVRFIFVNIEAWKHKRDLEDVKVSQRRVQQIIKQYKETGLVPVLGEKVGRPFKPYDEQEAEIVRAALPAIASEHGCWSR